MNVAYVPVRGGSKGIYKKNIRNLNGLPLLYYTMHTLEKCQDVDLMIVSTDDMGIWNVARDFKSSKCIIYEREGHNARDISTSESAMLEYFEKYEYPPESKVLLVQVTNPFLLPEDVSRSIEFMDAYDSVLTVTRDFRFVWDTTLQDPINYDPFKRPRRQDWDGIFIENGALYGTRLRHLLRDRCRISGAIGLVPMKQKYTQIEIDDMEDLIVAEVLLRRDGQRIEEIKKRLDNINLKFSIPNA